MAYSESLVLSDICSMKETFSDCLRSEIAKGVSEIDTDEIGKVVDILKDLCEAEKDLRKACYYKTVTESMRDEYSESRYRYGYHPDMGELGDMRYNVRSAAWDPWYNRDPEEVDETEKEYGKEYKDYLTAKRHYTETKEMSDKTEMSAHAKRHLANAIETVRDIYKNADPEQKKKIKTDFTALIGEMS